jgi:hypothetical protein
MSEEITCKVERLVAIERLRVQDSKTVSVRGLVFTIGPAACNDYDLRVGPHEP